MGCSVHSHVSILVFLRGLKILPPVTIPIYMGCTTWSEVGATPIGVPPGPVNSGQFDAAFHEDRDHCNTCGRKEPGCTSAPASFVPVAHLTLAFLNGSWSPSNAFATFASISPEHVRRKVME